MWADFYAVSRIVQIALLAAMGLVQSRLTSAEEAESTFVSDEELTTAFRYGLARAGEANSAFVLEIARYGHTLQLKSALRNEPDKKIAERICALCSKEEALAEARELGALTQCETTGAIPAHLVIEGKSPGIRVAVDNVPLVPLQVSHSVIPGAHALAVARGDKKIVKEIDVQEGKQIVLNLKPSLFAPSSKLRPALALSGLGLTAGGLGAMFLWFDGECQDRTCKDYFKFTAAGWAAIGTGIAIELGMVLWLLLADGEDELSLKEE